MLTTTSSRRSLNRYDTSDDSDFIHNYYERRVLQALITVSSRAQQDREFLADTACVALNRLPPRYIRHNVDMSFFMSPQELQEIEDKVTQAVAAAIDYVESREAGEAVAEPRQPQERKSSATARKSTKKESGKSAKSK
jgi:hypothetical protein